MKMYSSWIRRSGWLAIVPMLVLLACNGLGSSPNTSAPGGVDEVVEFWEACEEREDAIDDWEEREMRKLEEDFADGDRTLMGSMVKYELIEEDADAYREELMDNCRARADEDFPDAFPTPVDRRGDPFPTPTRR